MHHARAQPAFAHADQSDDARPALPRAARRRRMAGMPACYDDQPACSAARITSDVSGSGCGTASAQARSRAPDAPPAASSSTSRRPRSATCAAFQHASQLPRAIPSRLEPAVEARLPVRRSPLQNFGSTGSAYPAAPFSKSPESEEPQEPARKSDPASQMGVDARRRWIRRCAREQTPDVAYSPAEKRELARISPTSVS